MDRDRNATIGWIIGNRSAQTFKKFYTTEFKNLKNCMFYTDDWEAYSKILPKEKHVIGKQHTIGIEQNNSNIRHFLSGMTMRTKVVSKSIEMSNLSLRLCWHLNENEGYFQYQQKFLSIF